MSSELYLICPHCQVQGFTTQQLCEHRCPANAEQRLTGAELRAVVTQEIECRLMEILCEQNEAEEAA